MNGNISNINHLIHFIIGMMSNYFHYLTGLFILYQLIDGFKFKYKVIHFNLMHFVLQQSMSLIDQ